MKEKSFSFRKRMNSFRHAFNGLRILLKYEHNARIHLIIAFIVIITGLFLQLNTMEWIAVLLVIALVFITEIINSAVEQLADFVSPAYSNTIKIVKDYAAAAVLISAFAAIITGILIFLPKLILTLPL